MSQKKNYKVVSLSLTPDIHALMKASADKAGWNLSELVRNLVEKCLNLVVEDGITTTVAIDVPAHLKSDPVAMREYLNTKVEAIVNKLCSEL